MKGQTKYNLGSQGIPSGLFVHSEVLLDRLIDLGPNADLNKIFRLRDEAQATVFEWTEAINLLLLHIGQHADSIPIVSFRRWLGTVNALSAGLALSPVQVSDMRVLLILKNYYGQAFYLGGDKAVDILRSVLATEFGLSQNTINNLSPK